MSGRILALVAGGSGEVRNQNKIFEREACCDYFLTEGSQVVFVGGPGLLDQAMQAQSFEQSGDSATGLFCEVRS